MKLEEGSVKKCQWTRDTKRQVDNLVISRKSLNLFGVTVSRRVKWFLEVLQ